MTRPQILLTKYETIRTMKGFGDFVREYIEETASAETGTAELQDDRYVELSQKGELRCIAVVDDGVLAGAAVLLVTKSQHYPFPIIATESLYLRKPWRKGRLGLDLLGAMKALAVREGSPGLTFMAPPGGKLDRICRVLKMPLIRNLYWCACDE